MKICPDCGYELGKVRFSSSKGPGSVYRRGWLYFDCNDCGRNHKVRDGRVGTEGQCSCGASLVVPAVASSESGRSTASDVLDIGADIGCISVAILALVGMASMFVVKACS